MAEQTGLGPPQRFNATGFLIFYEIIDGNLIRSMQPLELAYRRSSGGGSPLVCLHSLSGASRSFAELAAGLHGRAEVIALDQRGFGESRRPTHDYVVDFWVEDAHRLMLAAECDTPVVFGHGFGACVAATLAARGLVSGVALSGVAFAPGAPAALGAIEAAGDEGEDITGRLADLVSGRPIREDLTPQIVARAVRAWQAFDGLSLPEAIKVPVLVLGGADDTLTPIDAEGGGEWFARQTRGRFVRIAGRHDLPAEEPAAVAEALRDWLDAP